jgi:bacillithiol biosynthesis cysteine-adding enzyme BshC
VDIRQFPGIRRLAGDYAYQFDRLASFFAGDPADPLEWRHAIARTLVHGRDRVGLATALANQQQRRGAPPEARAAVERLRDPRSVVIVTGQQAGLFGGPFYTLLKALTAIRLAARVREEHRVPAVPVFWIDAEDHDFDEVSGCEVLDADLRPTLIRLPPPPGAGERPVGALLLDEAITATIDELAAALPPTEFTATLLTLLRNAYRPGIAMSEAFGRWLEMVLGGLGLVVYDASDPATKPLARQVFAREVQFPGRTSELAASAGAELVELGYHSQVAAHADGLALFRLDGRRLPIHFADPLFSIGDATFDGPTLLGEVTNHPAAFSPNVLLRPIVQDTVFPTICYVAGPNELAYLAQLRAIYSQFGVPMPLMYPRTTATLLDSAAMRFLARNNVPFESLQAQDEAALNHLLEANLPPSIELAYQITERALKEGMQGLIEAVPQLDPTLEGAARSVLGRLEHDLDGLHSKIIHAAKRRDETLRRQFTRTRAQAFPGGHPQERSTGFVYFLNRYGPALVDRLLAELPLGIGQHWVLTV